MKEEKVKATITLDGQTYETYISQERAKQIKRLQKLIKESRENSKPLNTKANEKRNM